MHATHILWHAAGRPDYPQNAAGNCRVCGENGSGLPFGEWVADTYNNWDQLRPGDIICHICQFAFGQRDAELTRRTGKSKLQRMQNYSHIVCDGVWHPLHKGQKPEILNFLRQDPTLVAISTSGQKHIAFRARPGWWQVEEQCVKPNITALDHCMGLIAALYRVHNKTEIETEQYNPARTMQYVTTYGVDDYLEVTTALRAQRGTPYFGLALYLATKTEDADGDGDGSDRVSGAIPPGTTVADSAVEGTERRIQAAVRSQRVGAVRSQHTERGLHQQPKPHVQRSLFET